MALPLTIDEALFEWCTPRQREVLEAVNLHGSAKAASIALGINQGAASDAFIAVKKKAARAGYAPAYDFTRPVPDGYVAKGVSTYYDREGKPSGQWVKASLTHEALVEAMQEAVDGFKDQIDPQALSLLQRLLRSICAIFIPLPTTTLVCWRGIKKVEAIGMYRWQRKLSLLRLLR
jgi:hypothetical protein